MVEGRERQTPPVAWEAPSAMRGPQGDTEADHRVPLRGGARPAGGSVATRTMWPC